MYVIKQDFTEIVAVVHFGDQTPNIGRTTQFH